MSAVQSTARNIGYLPNPLNLVVSNRLTILPKL